MTLNEYQEAAIGHAVLDYILYVVPHHGQTPKLDSELNLCTMAEANLYFTMCMVLNTGKPEKVVMKKLDAEAWGPEDVIQYVREKY